MKKDKVYHLIAGFFIAFAFATIRPEIGLAAAIVAGVSKEVYDKYVKKSYADPLDTIFTVIGGVLGTAASILLQNIV